MKNGVRAHFSPTNERTGQSDEGGRERGRNGGRERDREMSVERKIKNSRLRGRNKG